MPPCTPRSVYTCYCNEKSYKIRSKLSVRKGITSLSFTKTILPYSIINFSPFTIIWGGAYPDRHPQLPCSSSTLHILDRDDPPVTSVSDGGVAYRPLVAAVICGVALGARLKGCACTSYGTIAGVRQLYGKYIPGVTIISHTPPTLNDSTW